MLLKTKGEKSFSEVIKNMFKSKNEDFFRMAGALKKDKKKLDSLSKRILAEREQNYGRKFNDW
ncbi:MAG: hypothetical protein KGH54_02205 [Candidatus Micrarchaeota archaeon]|nr:hypothetical protein [Candidatus Micrarchaeota archaeon]